MAEATRLQKYILKKKYPATFKTSLTFKEAQYILQKFKGYHANTKAGYKPNRKNNR